MISNTKDRIKELRKIVQSNKGKLDRAQTTAMFLNHKSREYRENIRRAQDEIIEMGGKVRR